MNATNMDHNILSSNLKLLRILADCTQEEAANALHMTRTSYVSIETGARSPKSTDTPLLAKFTDVDTSTLLHVDIRKQLRYYIKTAASHASEPDFINVYGQLSHRGQQNIRAYMDNLLACEVQGI